MIKRSQNKKFFSRDNYKVRLFVLTPVSLRYYESTEEVCDGSFVNKSNALLLIVASSWQIERYNISRSH